jgi:hypothetical protein
MAAPQYVCSDGTSDYSADRMTYYTRRSKMAAPQYVCADGPSDDTAYWMTYYTRHRKMAAPWYVCPDVTSNHTFEWRIYYRHDRNMAASHHLLVEVHSELSAKREEIAWEILTWKTQVQWMGNGAWEIGSGVGGEECERLGERVRASVCP